MSRHWVTNAYCIHTIKLKFKVSLYLLVIQKYPSLHFTQRYTVLFTAITLIIVSQSVTAIFHAEAVVIATLTTLAKS